MKSRFVSMMLIAVAVCACENNSTMVWSKAGATPQDFDRNQSQCQIQNGGPTYSLSGWFDSGRDERFRSCMQANGWSPISRPAGSAVYW
jgi:hypothetical protein